MTDIKRRRLRLRVGQAKGALANAVKADRDAEALRDLVAPLVLAGHNNEYIMGWLNDRRVVGPRGARWHSETVSRLVVRLGLRLARAA